MGPAGRDPTVGGGQIPLAPGGNGIIDPTGSAGLNGAQAEFAARMDMEQLLRDVYDEANKNNVALYMVDPRGLAVGEFDVSDGSVDLQSAHANRIGCAFLCVSQRTPRRRERAVADVSR